MPNTNWTDPVETERLRRNAMIAETAAIHATAKRDPLGAADFDRSKPYALVHGHPTRCYFQLGAYFDSHGKSTA